MDPASEQVSLELLDVAVSGGHEVSFGGAARAPAYRGRRDTTGSWRGWFDPLWGRVGSKYAT
jgi:hypothetical protein